MRLVVLSIACLFAQGVFAPLPLPPKRQGFPYKDCKPTAQIQWEVYLDINCPDSKTVFPALQAVADHFASNDRLCLVIYTFPLPFHPHAFTGSQAAFLVNSATNGTGVYRWFEVVYQNLRTISGISNIYQGIVKYSRDAEAVFGIPGTTSMRKILRDTSLWYQATMDFKHGASRGVAGTPTFFVNGIKMDADESWTADMWKSLFNHMLTTSNQWVRVPSCPTPSS